MTIWDPISTNVWGKSEDNICETRANIAKDKGQKEKDLVVLVVSVSSSSGR